MKVCRIVTVPFFLQNHLREQIFATVRAGHQVTLVCSPGPEVQDLSRIPGVRVHALDIPRQISLWRDGRALFELAAFFRKEKFDVVHSATPKAGMLAALAGRMTGVPVRLHTFTGQPWVEMKGWVRWLAMMGDRVTARCATLSYTDSHSQRRFIVDNSIVADDRVMTLGAGSIAGVDLGRFAPQRWAIEAEDVRRELGLPASARIITFVGRLTPDKGIRELVDAFRRLAAEDPALALILIGPEEPERDPLPSHTLEAIRNHPGIRRVGYAAEPARYLAITDVLCLPSYREGFPIVVIEAAAMGVPTVGSNIVGLRDSIVDGETGLLVPVKDVEALSRAIAGLLSNRSLRDRLGAAARQRVVDEFDAHVVNGRVLAEYDRLLRASAHGGES